MFDVFEGKNTEMPSIAPVAVFCCCLYGRTAQFPEGDCRPG